MERNHIGQIPTTYQTITTQLFLNSGFILKLLTKCIVHSGAAEYPWLLTIVSLYLERLSCFVFTEDDHAAIKPPADVYKRELFETYGETVEEIKRFIPKPDEESEPQSVHKTLWQIADVVCPMMACRSEQAFVQEYAYAIDYVIQHTDTLPKPAMKGLFPVNYNGFDPSKKSIMPDT